MRFSLAADRCLSAEQGRGSTLRQGDADITRLEIILLSGQDSSFVVAREYDAVTEYIQRIQIGSRSMGCRILTEEDFQSSVRFTLR